MDLINNSFLVIIIVSTGLVISIIWNLITSIQLSRLNKKYKKFMRGSSGKNFENLLIEQSEKVEGAVNQVNMINDEVVQLKHQMDKCIQKYGIVRYNAFNDTGSDLSFSIALLDNFNNGMLLTGIYGRNETITYAKPVENGASSYQTSTEEEIVLKRCLKNNIR